MRELKISISVLDFPHIGNFCIPWAGFLCLLIIACFLRYFFITFVKHEAMFFLAFLFIFHTFFLASMAIS